MLQPRLVCETLDLKGFQEILESGQKRRPKGSVQTVEIEKCGKIYLFLLQRKTLQN